MQQLGSKPASASATDLGIKNGTVYWNLPPEELTRIAIESGHVKKTSCGAITVNTGEFTGRSPRDKFIVKDEVTSDTVWWEDFNIPFQPEKFEQLYQKMIQYFDGKELFIRDVFACADTRYRLNIRVVNEYAWSNLFAHNMFLRPSEQELKNFSPEWMILNAPGFYANPVTDGTRRHNFSIIDFKRKLILIGGSGYTGEIKKAVFSALNFILPYQHNVLAMHCSANVGKKGDTAIFFGLSGTGKTTLSADPDRKLIGDDEHGWTDDDVIFNFEGGCYAKTIDLSEETEPDIFRAIKEGALLENVSFKDGTDDVDFSNTSITENTRVSYPIHHIENIAIPSLGNNPQNIFFLTCDAFGVLPPISKLSPGQAAFHFISGYTAKVAGTEAGITEPTMTFSACFGAPFMPLHPTHYASMLSAKIMKANVNVWLVNTGWTGGSYGSGNRIKLKYTRALIKAALNGELDDIQYQNHEVFGVSIPKECPGVPAEMLNPKCTWSDKEAYDQKTNFLAESFLNNFKKFEADASDEIILGAPKVKVHA